MKIFSLLFIQRHYCLFNNTVNIFSVLFNDAISTSDKAVSNYRVVNVELVKIWKESFVANLRYSPGAFLQRLRKTTRNLRWLCSRLIPTGTCRIQIGNVTWTIFSVESERKMTCCVWEMVSRDVHRRDAQVLQESSLHLQILDARRPTCSRFHTEGPHVNLTGAFCPVHVCW